MITYQFSGGLCNSILQIFGLFHFCESKNIDYNNIKINVDSSRWYLCDRKKLAYSHPFRDNYDFFKNIENYFISDKEYKIFKDSHKYKIIHYIPKDRYLIQEKDNLLFTGCGFLSDYTIRLKKDLFMKLFYNKECFYNVYQKHIDFLNNNYCGIHCRRSDFSLVNDTRYNSYVYTKEKIVDIINCNTDKKIAIFTDDVEYYKFILKDYNIIYPIIDKDYEHLCLMGICHKLYLTPGSTFSRIGKAFKDLLSKKEIYNDFNR